MQTKYVAWVIVVVAILVAGYLGVSYPIPAPPTAQRAVVFPEGVIQATEDGKVMTFPTGSTLTVESGATETHAGTVTFSAAPTINNNATITGTLTLGGAAMSGPVRFGSASTVVTGTTIAHGLATTPTVALLTAGIPITTPLYITARNATSITVGINDGVSVSTVFWIAGK